MKRWFGMARKKNSDEPEENKELVNNEEQEKTEDKEKTDQEPESVADGKSVSENARIHVQKPDRTDSVIESLRDIDDVAKESKRIIPLWLPVSVAILFLLLGIGLGFAGNSVIARQQPQTTPTSTTASNPVPETVSPTVVEKPQEVEKSDTNSCGGFNYIVKKGDSLSLIASHFYGDINSWSRIIDANPKLKGRESSIEIGELLLVPNLETHCSNS